MIHVFGQLEANAVAFGVKNRHWFTFVDDLVHFGLVNLRLKHRDVVIHLLGLNLVKDSQRLIVECVFDLRGNLDLIAAATEVNRKGSVHAIAAGAVAVFVGRGAGSRLCEVKVLLGGRDGPQLGQVLEIDAVAERDDAGCNDGASSEFHLILVRVCFCLLT